MAIGTSLAQFARAGERSRSSSPGTNHFNEDGNLVRTRLFCVNSWLRVLLHRGPIVALASVCGAALTLVSLASLSASALRDAQPVLPARPQSALTTEALLRPAPSHQAAAVSAPPASAPLTPAEQRTLMERYCIGCHNRRSPAAGFDLDTLSASPVGEHPEAWEKVVRKLRGGLMPPAGRPRPDGVTYENLRVSLEAGIDGGSAGMQPGRTAAFHRLSRSEYQHAVRDILAVDLDLTSWLPGDPSSYGFDNIGDALSISSGLLEQYLSVAQRIARIAVGGPASEPNTVVHVVPSDLTQRDWLNGLPFGTRGGALITHTFPVDGEYAIQLRLGRNYNTRINGLAEAHQVEISIDGDPVQQVTIGGQGKAVAENNLGAAVIEDDPLKVRLPLKAGQHQIAAAFIKHSSAEYEDIRRSLLRDRVEYGDTQGLPTLSRVEISGPYNPTGTAETPSRQRILVCRPRQASEEVPCARKNIATLARRAYRRPAAESDVDLLMRFYHEGAAEGGFERGMEMVVTRALVSPNFLFRIERDPAGATQGGAFRVSDFELATRLSFFLWNSVPDDELLTVAESGQLRQPAVLGNQVRRMLLDAKSDALVTEFAGQWLHLRNIPQLKPDRWLFPDVDQNLKNAFRTETEMFISSIIRDDRSALDLFRADYTFLNERLARHYGMDGVYGDHFRRVALADPSRYGLLGQGSILTLTSAANRTSPVRRGIYILENFLGVSPPPPPPDIPALVEATSSEGKVLSMRERMAVHRKNPVCASCHGLMDPLGLPMENFDAVGQWRRTAESGAPLDVSGVLPDGTSFDGVSGLREMLLKQPEPIVMTITEKLLTYALGRGLEYYDEPTVRRITHDARSKEYTFASLIGGIVQSPAFQMKQSLNAAGTRQ